MPATEKSDRLDADRLRTKRRRAEETEERASLLQSYIIYTARCSHQSLRNCSTRLRSLPVSAIAVRVADIRTRERLISRWRSRSYWQLRYFSCAQGQRHGGGGELGDDEQRNYGDSTTQ